MQINKFISWFVVAILILLINKNNGFRIKSINSKTNAFQEDKTRSDVNSFGIIVYLSRAIYKMYKMQKIISNMRK